MVRSLALRFCRSMLRRWLPLASLGLMLTCGTGTGTGNATPVDPRQDASSGTVEPTSAPPRLAEPI